MTTGARVGAKYLCLSWRQTGEKGGKKFVVHATVPGKKKRRKVRTEMLGGVKGEGEGNLSQLQRCQKTFRKAENSAASYLQQSTKRKMSTADVVF